MFGVIIEVLDLRARAVDPTTQLLDENIKVLDQTVKVHSARPGQNVSADYIAFFLFSSMPRMYLEPMAWNQAALGLAMPSNVKALDQRLKFWTENDSSGPKDECWETVPSFSYVSSCDFKMKTFPSQQRRECGSPGTRLVRSQIPCVHRWQNVFADIGCKCSWTCQSTNLI